MLSQTLNLNLNKTKGEHRGKPSLKRTRREDVKKTHTAVKQKNTRGGGGANRLLGSELIGKSDEIDRVIEKLLVKEDCEQYERELLKEFQQFDGRTRNKELMQSILRMQRLTQNDPSNVAVKAQLRSK